MKTLKLFLIATLIINSFAQTGFASREGTQYDCDRGVKFQSQSFAVEENRFRGNRDFTLNLGLLTSYVATSLTVIGVIWPVLNTDDDGHHRRLHHAYRKENSDAWYKRQRLNVELRCLEGLASAVPAEALYLYSCSLPERVRVRNGYRIQSQFMEHVDALPMTLEDAQAHCGG